MSTHPFLRAFEPLPHPVEGLLTCDPAMVALAEQIAAFAKHPVSVLLLGESGSGKEVLARALHALSPQKKGPFIAINCAAIPEALLESELFGHEKGAFTGAMRQVIGKIESADNGVLFLDEIGDLPASLQPKLLRFLENRTIERVGGREPIALDVRVIAATHQPIEQWIQTARFRPDLYYRLGEISLKIPPLRARGSDSMMLAAHFATLHTARFGVRRVTLSHETLAAIEQYPWPGNVRELQNRIKRGVLVCKGPFIEPGDMDLAFDLPFYKGIQLKQVRRHAERSAVARALAYMQYDVGKTASLLGISETSLTRLLEKHGEQVPG